MVREGRCRPLDEFREIEQERRFDLVFQGLLIRAGRIGKDDQHARPQQHDRCDAFQPAVEWPPVRYLLHVNFA